MILTSFYSDHGYTFCTQITNCYLIKDEKLFKEDKKKQRLPKERHCFIKKKEIKNSDLIDLVLINHAYLKLKKLIDNSRGSIQLNTTMINDNGIAEKINFFIKQFYPTFKIDNLHNLHNRLPFNKHLSNKRIPKKYIKKLVQVNSIQECYMNCKLSNCDYFNICKDESTNKNNCELLGSRLDEQELNNSLENNTRCDVYEIKNLNLFDKYEEHRFLSKPLENLKLNLKDCTTACLNRKDKECKSIVFCNDNLCELTNEHMENRLNKIEPNKNCTIYSINYLEDYHQISFKPIPEDKRKIFATIKGCALNCVESNEYISFNFCPLTMENTDIGKCSCTSKNDTISNNDDQNWNCITMQKNLKSFFYSNELIDKKSTKSNGYTFLKVAEISMIVFIIGNLIGIFVYYAIHQIRKTPSKNLNFKIPKIKFRKKSDQIEIIGNE